jgi:hypothetical protein
VAIGASTSTLHPRGIRASGVGRANRRLGWWVFIALVFGVAVTIGGLLASNSSAPAAQYPSFLPARTLHPHVDGALVGTMAKPALSIEGLPVDVRTAHWNVDITVSGPVVPGEGLPYQPAATTCTWTVTMSNATANVPISLADFHSVDHVGSIFLMNFVPGASPPAVLHPGQSVTFQMRAYELVGEGMMQWAPDHKHVVADWDYTVEND